MCLLKAPRGFPLTVTLINYLFVYKDGQISIRKIEKKNCNNQDKVLF